MDIRARRVESAVILRFEGRMIAETGSGWLQGAAVAATAEGVRHALLDLGGLRQLDCAGIGHLLQMRARVHATRRTVALTSVERRQILMLKRAGLLHVFRVFVDNQAALTALGVRERAAPWAAAEAAALVPAAACWSTALAWPALECVS